MVTIKIERGLDIPVTGTPSKEDIQPLAPPKQVALNLDPFDDVKFRLLVRVGDTVKIGQALAEDKGCKGRMFVSPGGGKVVAIKRGLKRRLLDVVVERDKEEAYEDHRALDPSKASREEIIEHLKKGGLFAHVRMRPFDLLADPNAKPKAIFVKAIESAPYAPPAEIQIQGNEKAFQTGLDTLARLTDQGHLHLVYRDGTECVAFTEAKQVVKHPASGPHPVANHSVHIQAIEPIRSVEDHIWTLNVADVVCMGHMMLTGRYHIEKVITVAGPALIEDRRGYFKVRKGYPIDGLLAGRNLKGAIRMISGDPLTGRTVEVEDFLGFYDTVFCVFFENTQRELLHFFRLGAHKFTNTGTYLSGFLKTSGRTWDFTTNMHGEERAFVDGSVYQEVQPLCIPTMHLVKAMMAQDFEEAEILGGLEVASEDFALPTFVCPCKVEMVDIVKQGLRDYAREVMA